MHVKRMMSSSWVPLLGLVLLLLGGCSRAATSQRRHRPDVQAVPQQTPSVQKPDVQSLTSSHG